VKRREKEFALLIEKKGKGDCLGTKDE